jgi:hypothetical protein
MITTRDVLLFAARQGFALSPSIVDEALATVDQEAMIETEKARYEVLVWDGKSDVLGSPPSRFLHGKDAISQAAIENLANGHAVYFLIRDGQIHHWQPYRAYTPGHVPMSHDPEHPHYVHKAAQEHLEMEARHQVRPAILEAAFEAALRLHEKKGVPVVAAGARR